MSVISTPTIMQSAISTIYTNFNENGIKTGIQIYPEKTVLIIDGKHLDTTDYNLSEEETKKFIQNYISIYSAKDNRALQIPETNKLFSCIEILKKVYGTCSIKFLTNINANGEIANEISTAELFFTVIIKSDQILLSVGRDYNKKQYTIELEKLEKLEKLEELLIQQKEAHHLKLKTENELYTYIVNNLAFIHEDSTGYCVLTKFGYRIQIKVSDRINIRTGLIFKKELANINKEQIINPTTFEYSDTCKCKEFLNDLCKPSTWTDRQKNQMLMRLNLISFNSCLIDPLKGCPFLQNDGWCESGYMKDTDYGFKSYKCGHMIG